MKLEPVTEAVIALQSGDVVCIPTESTYGLAADLRSAPALHRLAALKHGRPAASPWPVIAPDLPAARALAAAWPEAADRLAERHWPGPLTIVVPARPDLPLDVVGPAGGVAVRVSSHPLASAVARALGAPITATSANLPGCPPATTAVEARAVFGDGMIYLDGGTCDGVASTLVAVAPDGTLTVLRRGAVELTADS